MQLGSKSVNQFFSLNCLKCVRVLFYTAMPPFFIHQQTGWEDLSNGFVCFVEILANGTESRWSTDSDEFAVWMYIKFCVCFFCISKVFLSLCSVVSPVDVFFPPFEHSTFAVSARIFFHRRFSTFYAFHNICNSLRFCCCCWAFRW